MPALYVFSGSGMASIGNKDVDSIAVVGGYGQGEALEPIRASRYTYLQGYSESLQLYPYLKSSNRTSHFVWF